MKNQRLVACLLCFVFSSLAIAQDQNPSRRPRLGLALSGGGALGLAHIGVLQYFEEHHIPVDMVAGTSMGGLVGGFYASGLDSKAIHQIVEHADWDMLLNPNPRFADQPVIEKQQWNRTLGNITLRFGKRFSLPAGLNPGEALALLLSRNTAAYGDLNDFSELPTPFRCVATDLVSGDAVVLSSGSLARAMRATMALPAIFTPVKWDNKVLIDGGLVQNVPVEVVRDMGADKTIAVTLEAPPAKAEQFKSMLGILRQTVSIAVLQNERRSLKLADLVIPVDTANFDTTDYAKSQALIRAGYAAAQAKAAELAEFAVSPEEWNAYIQARERKTGHIPHEGRVVEVAATDASFEKNAQAELSRKLGSGVVNEEQLEDVLSGIVAAAQVPGGSYRWDANQNGYRIDFMARSGEQILARPSFRLGISSGEPSRAALQLSTSLITAGAYKSRLLFSTTLGFDPGIRTEYYHPFDGTGYFVAPGMLVQRSNVSEYSGGTRTSATRDRFAGTFYGGLGTWRFVQIRFGMQAGYDSYSKPLVVDGVPAHSHGFANPEAVWIFNTQDSGGLPYRGTHLEGSAGYSFRNTSFPYFRNDFSTFQSVSKNVSVFLLNTAATSFGEKLNYFEQFTAGGAEQLSAFRYQEFHANTVVTAGGGILVHGPPVYTLSVYPGLAVWYEAGRMDLGSRGWATHQSTSAGVFFPTPLGAAGLGISFDEHGKARFRLSLGSFGK